MKGMPFEYNEMIRRHPDSKEFVETCWKTQCRKSDRIVELEAALSRIVKHWEMSDRGPGVGYSKQEEAIEQARAVLNSRRPKRATVLHRLRSLLQMARELRKRER